MEQLKTDKDRYIYEWTRTQLAIWQEKVRRMGVVRSGRLHESFTSAIRNVSDGNTIEMKFAAYGIYQALGVGNGYYHDNPGDLEILDPEYREKHGLNERRWAGPMPGYSRYLTSGKPRKRRDWYSKKLYMSMRALIEDLARITGEAGMRAICDQLSDTRAAIS